MTAANTKGALLMIGSMAAFTVSDTFVKATGGQVPLFQLITLRTILTAALLGVLAWRLGALRFSANGATWGLIGLRCLGEIGAAYFFLTALLNMPLANITAILQVLPLVVTLGAFLFFKEPIGWRRLSAIFVGFGGMLLIVRPGPDGFSLYAGYALAAVLCVTLRDLATRRMPDDIPSLGIAFLTSVAVLIAAAFASLTEEWRPVAPHLAALIFGSSLFIMCGYLLSVLVMRVGEVSFVAPFRYTSLLWALVLGWFVFGDWPDTVTLIGAGILVASGVFTFYRERQVSGV
ncbi:DMT family transporter [Thalassococcus sp. S3]|uniref:DMT family transporter n=1 Tax=Thalassococcus sp. S3 TaxID=2017482 RepID=UPI0020C48FD8|nr:DMT family transporter [Thalassococcus sp. S3]